ncbi:MAG: AtpZ/AtpI family protein [Candidatus Cyclonatronum sp.]|uniref:AtpZ/AtpI family protein n=1 Tax=Cyclonatronum sp. TaxID=3024185 RepID=UPI0034453B6A|nr:AtpZ/AtpI family protein [Balneolales bacterium]MCH8485371.1 AtpZ/AtpI family protein [Cyclonatronum sp.]
MDVRGFGQYIQFGLQVGITMSVPVLIGVWLDNRYDTGPWLMLAGIFLGFISMLWTIYKTALELNEKDRHNKKKNKL